MKFDKKSIIDIVIMILIAIVAIFFMWNVLVKDSDKQTKTKKSVGQNETFNKPEEIQKEIQKAMPGVSPVAEGGQVVTLEGKPVKLDVTPGDLDAPQQSNPITNLKQIPSQAIKLIVTEKGLQPSSFEVKAGQVVNFVITSGDSNAHMFKFKDSSLSAVVIGLSKKETRAIVFNAPEKVGEYEFFCDVPGHDKNVEKGKMIVRPIK
ncbi:hypothetical protein CVV26_01500 [Candidatus Kuenenbacteria bacterium HGW-Kuenenbacteria-1]|uniref:EfeO-type cupredoxin-like domain-containing protein n=1 Tax=Candidatus Kuenenbacteria bacterium HGW-Kuenenbacteria-1 TaxID=2013812 RepID=A0A2N1UNL8_9BACT|nr:MAG: hypothetical protein CVV26_01500 [Candidatus Kuenenbacteria bacterium HGW-Kuenenbacteria-1]